MVGHHQIGHRKILPLTAGDQSDAVIRRLSCFLSLTLLLSCLPISLCAEIQMAQDDGLEMIMNHALATHNGWVPDSPLTCPSGANCIYVSDKFHAHIMHSALIQHDSMSANQLLHS